MSTSRLSRYVVALCAIAAIVGAGIVWSRSRKPAGPKYETAKVERGRLVAKVTATGTLSALVTVQVGAQVSGRIAALYADYNSPVKKGQTIAKLDPQLFAAAVAQARANVAAQAGQVLQAQVNARNLDLQRKRSRELRAKNLIAQADLDTAEAAADAAAANIEVQKGQLAQARANLSSAEVNLEYTTIKSPTDGTVISRAVDVGQTVAASLSAPTLFTIAQDLTRMQVDTSVAEADVGRLVAGGEATFTVDAYPGERFKGTIRQIRNAPQTVQNVVTYDAVIDVANPDLRLKPGMTANVSFVYADRPDALKVPNAALRFRPPADLLGKDGSSGGNNGRDGKRDATAKRDPAARGAWKKDKEQAPDQKTVWLLDGDAAADPKAPPPRPRPVRVKTGVSDGSSTEIVEGDLKEGQLLVTDVTSTAGDGGGGKPAGGGNRMPRMF